MSTKPIFLLRKAKKSSGEPDATLWASDDFESACATLDYLIVKSGKKLSSYFKVVATNFPVVDDLPPEGEIDFTWCTRYHLAKDNMTWMKNPDVDTETGEVPEDHNENFGNEGGNTSPAPELTTVATLPFRHRVIAQCMADGEYLYHVDKEQMTNILRLEMDTQNTFIQNIILAAENVEPFKNAIEIDIHRAVVAFKTVFPVDGKTPELTTAIQFFKAWFGTEYIDRGVLVKEWQKGNRISGITGTSADTTTDDRSVRQHKQTWNTLDLELAIAFWPGDVAPGNVDGSVLRWAKSEIIGKDREDWKRFSASMRKQPEALLYDPETILGLVRNRPEDIHKDPVALNEYISEYLTTHGVQEKALHTKTPATSHTLTADEKGTVDDEEKPQPAGTVADEPAAPETVEPDPAEYHQDPQPLDDQSPVDVEYEKKRAELHEARANIPAKNIPQPEQESASDEVEKTENSSEVIPEPSTVPDNIQPGIYHDIPNEAYHAGPGVSKSQLDDIADTPALYLWRKNAPVDPDKTRNLDMGTAFHCRILEPQEFSRRFIVAPEFNRRTNAGKEEEKAFYEHCASTGKTVITAEDGRKIELMYQSVMALPLGQWLVESAGYCESSIYWEDPETGILCRCRPDKIIPEYHWIMDVKTTADIHRFKTAYYDYRYHVQDAFYSDGYQAQFGEQPTFVFLAVSTTAECGRYPVEIFMMGEDAKLAGQQEYHRNLHTLSECTLNDEWPAIKTLTLPRWAKEYAND